MTATEVMEASVFDADPVRRLGRDSTGSLMTIDEFHEIDDVEDGLRYELLQGVVIVSPAPSESKRDLNEELGYLLRVYRDSHPLGWNLDATMSEQELDTFAVVRRADRAIWTGLGRLPTPRQDFPSIVVECVSRLSRDRRRDYEQKLHEYDAAGVREYWIIDRFRRTLTVCAGGQVARVVREVESYTTPLLPGFELPLAKLLSLADRWPQQLVDSSICRPRNKDFECALPIPAPLFPCPSRRSAWRKAGTACTCTTASIRRPGPAWTPRRASSVCANWKRF